MTPKKWIVLAIYLVLAAVGFAMAGTQTATIIGWIFVVLLVAHVAELLLVFKLLRSAEGSFLNHVIQTLVFGYIHWLPIKQQRG